MVLRVRTDEVFYKPNDVATATTTADPDYIIRCTVDGIVINESENAPLNINVDPEWVGGVMWFEVVKDGACATTHAHVEPE